MKQIFSLLLAGILCTAAKAQVVLNEIYGDPGGSNNEFFELYNTSTSATPISLDGYTIVTYFESGGSTKGFYVLDLPNLSIGPKGFFVAASGLPFNFQGITGSTAAQFSWNDLAFLATHNGYLKKWVVGSAVPAAIDGNASYDEQVLPGAFNDFFYSRSGGGANYSVFVYKNGILINAFFGGTGGSTSVPSFITAMPKLNIDMAGGGNFSINFPAYAGIAAEYSNQNTGTDNGFSRTGDGVCNSWTKSSSGAHHTPDGANGSQSGISGTVSLSSSIARGATPVDSSKIVYGVSSAPAASFPITMDLYVDNGLVPGELDASDTYLTSNTATGVGNSFTTKFLPYDQNVVIAVKTAAGCYDKVMQVSSQKSTLPLHLLAFNGSLNNKKAQFEWSVAENETGNYFEVEKGLDGVHFGTIGVVFCTATAGTELYKFKEQKELASAAYYRLKMVNRDGTASYSKTVRLSVQTEITTGNIRLLQNPVESYLSFQYESGEDLHALVSIYSMGGEKLYTTEIAVRKGSNTFSIAAGGRIQTGMYLLEVLSTNDKRTVKFIKK